MQRARATMWESCGGASVGIAVGVFLLALLLVCGMGCAWPWKHRGPMRFATPRFLQRRSSRGKDFHAKSFCWRSLITGSRTKTSDETKGHTPTVEGARVQDAHYENVGAGFPKDKRPTEEALYENTRQSNLEEHVYRNQTWSHYYNLQNPHTPEAPQEEDIYILPD